MAKQKKLRKAAAKFRRAEPELHKLYSIALSEMARYIMKTGNPEVTCNIYNFSCNAYE